MSEEKKKGRPRLKDRTGVFSKKNNTKPEPEVKTDGTTIEFENPPADNPPTPPVTPEPKKTVKDNKAPEQVESPLVSEAPDIREYAKSQAKIVGGEKGIPDIPEPVINPVLIDLNAPPPKTDDEIKAEKEAEKAKKEPDPVNPQFGDLSPEQKKEGAEYLAKTIIDAYCGLLNYAKDFVKLTPDKLKRKAIRGKFDMALLEFEVKLSEAEEANITLGQYIETLNAVLDENIGMTDEEKKEAKELLILILSKHGLGLTPEQRLIVIFGMNAMRNGQILLGVRSQMRDLIELTNDRFKEMINLQKAEGERVRRESDELLKERERINNEKVELERQKREMEEMAKMYNFREPGEEKQDGRKDDDKEIIINPNSESQEQNTGNAYDIGNM